MENINPITQAYQSLLRQGMKPALLYSGNPNDQGIHYPSPILREAYQDYFNHQTYRPDPKGLKSARAAIAEYYASQDFKIDPENIILTSGTSESFFYLFSLLAKAGENVLVPNPAYPLFDHVAELAKIELRHYPLKESEAWKIDLAQLKRQTDEKTRAILLVSPNNPTGAVHDEEEIREVVAWANQHDIALICDEVFAEFCFTEKGFPRAAAVSRPQLCFTLNGISKMLALPALKLSWIAVSGTSSEVAVATDRLETIADTFLSCHTPIQESLPRLLSAGRDFLKDYKNTVRERRDEVYGQLRSFSRLQLTQPKGGFYLMARVVTEKAFSEEDFVIGLLREKNVFVHPGYFFDYGQGRHFVISFLTNPEVMRPSLTALIEFIQEHF